MCVGGKDSATTFSPPSHPHLLLTIIRGEGGWQVIIIFMALTRCSKIISLTNEIYVRASHCYFWPSWVCPTCRKPEVPTTHTDTRWRSLRAISFDVSMASGLCLCRRLNRECFVTCWPWLHVISPHTYPPCKILLFNRILCTSLTSMA